MTYFSPEPLAALKAAGYRGFWMGYFAGRAAPLGRASAELTEAVFYNFDHDHVARAVPDAWTFAPPESALRARLGGSAAALRRMLGPEIDTDEVERLADALLVLADAAPVGGRALFAANRALPVPADPVERLWHAATLLREHRGDGHVAALVAAGIGGREAHVLHSLATGTPLAVYARSRRLGETETDVLRAGLRERGLVDDSGLLTSAGRARKVLVEQQTDALAWSACSGCSTAELDALLDALRPITRTIVASGDIPAQSPIGLDLGGG